MHLFAVEATCRYYLSNICLILGSHPRWHQPKVIETCKSLVCTTAVQFEMKKILIEKSSKFRLLTKNVFDSFAYFSVSGVGDLAVPISLSID